MNEQYNIALCVSGEMRWPESLIQSVENLSTTKQKELYNIDIFIHAWDQITYSAPQNKKKEPFDIQLNVRRNNLKHEHIINELKPKKTVIDQADILDPLITHFKDKNESFRKNRDIDLKVKYSNYTCLAQFYSMSRANYLRKEYERVNNIQYDIVIRTRSDVLISKFDVHNVLRKLAKHDHKPLHKKPNKNTGLIYCPWIRGDHERRTLMDYATLVGRPHSMDAVFDNFPECLVEQDILTTGTSSHSLFYKHINDNYVRLYCPVPFAAHLKRGPDRLRPISDVDHLQINYSQRGQ